MNIFITGANQGIGYYLAEGLLELGHRVTVLDVETTKLLTLEEKYPGQLLPLVCDVRDTVGMRAAVQKSADTYGAIDIAIHNACLCTFGSMKDTGNPVYEEVFNVNYYGALRLARAVVPYMEKEGKGRVIFTSSGVGVMGFPDISPYASSKGAVEALAKCLNLEYMDKGIRFQLFHPPLTRTKSAAPLPIPKDFMADPLAVGHGLARRINKKSFYICHTARQQLLTALCYLFPVKMGESMSKLLKKKRSVS